jgi:hypothetical protein
MTIRWQYFPQYAAIPQHLMLTVGSFQQASGTIETPTNQLSSNQVLSEVADGLEEAGYIVERGKTKSQKISRPVLYGKDGKVDKQFEVDAWHEETGSIIEVEAGRGVVNHQFLKDFFEACVIQDANYLTIAVCQGYQPESYKSPANDFETVTTFFETIYASRRLAIPLKGILIIGY